MTILDANVLLYAYNEEAPECTPVQAWLQEEFRRGEAIGLPWISMWAFLRISTHPRINRRPLTLSAAFQTLDEIFSMPGALIPGPGKEHAAILVRCAKTGQAAGAHMTDAVLAALAIEHGARLASTDRNFGRFPGLKWINPLNVAAS